MEDTFVSLHNPTQFSLSPRKRRRCALDLSEVRKCNKLDKFMKKSESSLKRGNTMVGETEAQQQSEGWKMVTSRAKKTRRSSLKNMNFLEKTANPKSVGLLPLLSIVDDSSLNSSSAAGRASSKSTTCDSSASNSEDADSDPASKPSRRSKKLDVIGELKSHNDQQTFRTGEYLDLKVEKVYQSLFAGKCVEATCSFLDPDNQDVMDAVLVDVQLTVHASPRARNVPFVSLRSEAYGRAVLGYPLDVGQIRDASETGLLPESGDQRSRLDKLVWRTSKRTPICYVSSLLSASASKNVQVEPASINVNSMLPARAKGLLKKGKSRVKLQKNRKQFNQGKTALKKTCVPVELIFSKILAAVG